MHTLTSRPVTSNYVVHLVVGSAVVIKPNAISFVRQWNPLSRNFMATNDEMNSSHADAQPLEKFSNSDASSCAWYSFQLSHTFIWCRNTCKSWTGQFFPCRIYSPTNHCHMRIIIGLRPSANKNWITVHRLILDGFSSYMPFFDSVTTLRKEKTANIFYRWVTST